MEVSLKGMTRDALEIEYKQISLEVYSTREQIHGAIMGSRSGVQRDFM